MDITYYIDGVNLTTYGVYISSSDGLINRPKPKQPVSASWKDYHGEVVDLTARYYESRKIKLNCFIKATSKEDFVTKMNVFLQLFDLPGTRRLMVAVDAAKPLVYEVFLSGDIEPKKKWSDGTMAGTFDLELTEPSPVKRVVRHIRTSDATKTISMTISSPKVIDIYWGDGTVTRDVSGTGIVVTHNYAANGTYYAVVAGNIDEITSYSTSGSIIWNKL